MYKPHSFSSGCARRKPRSAPPPLVPSQGFSLWSRTHRQTLQGSTWPTCCGSLRRRTTEIGISRTSSSNCCPEEGVQARPRSWIDIDHLRLVPCITKLNLGLIGWSDITWREKRLPLKMDAAKDARIIAFKDDHGYEVGQPTTEYTPDMLEGWTRSTWAETKREKGKGKREKGKGKREKGKGKREKGENGKRKTKEGNGEGR